MKYLKKFEYYNSSDTDKLSNDEIVKIASQKKFQKPIINNWIHNDSSINYTEYIENLFLENVLQLNDFGIRYTQQVNGTGLHFYSSVQYNGLSFDVNLDTIIYHNLKKIKISLQFWINEDVDGDYSFMNTEDITEDTNFIDTVNYFNNNIKFENLSFHFDRIKDSMAKFSKYCYGKYGAIPY